MADLTAERILDNRKLQVPFGFTEGYEKCEYEQAEQGQGRLLACAHLCLPVRGLVSLRGPHRSLPTRIPLRPQSPYTPAVLPGRTRPAWGL
jgi:hypothetical protein